MRAKIIERALRCVDEIYPYDSAVNIHQFPFDDFLDEAARRVLLTAPLHAISMSASFQKSVLTDNGDGSGSIVLPCDFLRLIRFRMRGWLRPVLVPLPEDNPLYLQQFNHVTRGGKAKPIVVLCAGNTRLEYYSVPDGVHEVVEARYIPFSAVNDIFPDNLIEITAWVLASLVLGVSNDTKGASDATTRASELMMIL